LRVRGHLYWVLDMIRKLWTSIVSENVFGFAQNFKFETLCTFLPIWGKSIDLTNLLYSEVSQIPWNYYCFTMGDNLALEVFYQSNLKSLGKSRSHWQNNCSGLTISTPELLIRFLLLMLSQCFKKWCALQKASFGQ